MTSTVSGIHGGLDTHANRPAGNAVPDGSLYSCSTHSLIYKSNLAGNSWATWGTLSAGAGSIISAAKAYNSATQSIPGSNTITALTFDSEDANNDPDGYHSTSSNTSRMTVPTGKGGALFRLAATGFVGGNSAGYGSFRVNGTTIVRGGGQSLPAVAAYCGWQAEVYLVDADYVEAIVSFGNAQSFGHASVVDAMATFTIARDN